MSDPAIKLFGKTIALPLASEEGGGDYTCKTSPFPDETKDQDPPKSEDKHEPITSTVADDSQKPSSDDDRKTEEKPNDSSNPQEKPLKKPDKILPCPRCNSMDTKFCYYNNYNVNQPRHFCKNCQRYWTAGGTMRNVPVGAGRRKNKNSTYRHLTVSDATLPAAFKTNGTVLTFGSDTPICESMASVLTLSDKARMNCSRNEEQSTGCSATNASNCNSIDDGNGANLQEPVIQNYQGVGHHLPCINSPTWPYCWSPTPIQFYPAPAYWGCGNWSMPWFAPQLPPPSPIITSPISSGSGPLSPTLGKHSREGNVLSRDNNNSSSNSSSNNHKNSLEKGEGVKKGNLWIPKTLRIGDPEEAAKSSIWATMGFNKDKGDSISSRGLFKAFETKAERNNHNVDANSRVIYANPAALSRSINFQESS